MSDTTSPVAGGLTSNTMVTTNCGLARLGELGDMWGDAWLDLDTYVSTDDGPRRTTKHFAWGEEPTRRLVTEGGYRIQGTPGQRVKVVEPGSGEWVWKRIADTQPCDLVPMQFGTMIGERLVVPMPVLDQAYYAGDHQIAVPDVVTPDLAELAGYFMGDGSLHAKGIRLCVADTDLDVVERLRVLSKELFNLEPMEQPKQGYREITLSSVRLARWWKAAGFAKVLPNADHTGKGWKPRIPSALLETNSISVYSRFLRGLFEADGTVQEGVPSLSTASEEFANEVRTLLLVLGMASTTRETVSGYGGPIFQVRLRNIDHAIRYDEFIGFMSDRKNSLLASLESPQAGNRDRIYLPRGSWDEIVPVGSNFRSVMVSSVGKSGGVSRQTAQQVYAEIPDDRLAFALDHIFERVAANEDAGVQQSFEISVPQRATFVASGFISHGTHGCERPSRPTSRR